MREAIKRKKAAFASGDRNSIKTAQKNLKCVIWKAKRVYKQKIENKVQDQNSKAVWDGMRLITGCGVTREGLMKEGVTPNEVNSFFARFDKYDFSSEQAQVSLSLLQRDSDSTLPPVTITVDQVRHQLKRIKTNKGS